MGEECDSAENTGQNQPQDQEHPWPYLCKLVSISGINKDSYKIKCILCLPPNNEVSGVLLFSPKTARLDSVSYIRGFTILKYMLHIGIRCVL